MTDKEIIKALECLCGEKILCMDCEYKADGFPSCRINVAIDALDLIKQQQAEIERLRKLQKPTGAGGFRIENGKVVFYSDTLNGYRHEYKDLDEIVKELNLYMHTDYKNIELISHYKHKAQTAKSEAVKEFAERIKAIYPPRDDKRCTLDDCYVLDYIDNLVKEMVGEAE